MTPQRRDLLVNQILNPALINFVLNFAIIAMLFRKAVSIPLKGQGSMVADLIYTSFLLPFLTCLIATPLARRATARAMGISVPLKHEPGRRSSWLPGNTFWRALLIGVAALVVLTPVIIAAALSLHLQSAPVMRYALLKGLLAAVFAAAITPPIVHLAVSDVIDASPGWSPYRGL